ncbi:MAG: hypothetical protein KDI88_08120 [Gammaproteobacteria bacterium]|nr:hypothetical protein [Gammaproteobacteria bacterium]
MQNAETNVANASDPKHGSVIALPPTVSDLIEQRKSKTKKTLHDQVEDLHLSLWENAAYQALLDAVYPEQAIEGSLFADDFEAARMIREAAKKKGNAYVAGQKLETLRKSLSVVLRRYGISRKERRDS